MVEEEQMRVLVDVRPRARVTATLSEHVNQIEVHRGAVLRVLKP